MKISLDEETLLYIVDYNDKQQKSKTARKTITRKRAPSRSYPEIQSRKSIYTWVYKVSINNPSMTYGLFKASRLVRDETYCEQEGILTAAMTQRLIGGNRPQQRRADGEPYATHTIRRDHEQFPHSSATHKQRMPSFILGQTSDAHLQIKDANKYICGSTKQFGDQAPRKNKNKIENRNTIAKGSS